MQLIAAQPLTNTACQSKLSFSPPEGKEAGWSRHLFCGDVELFALGSPCDTCEFFFTRGSQRQFSRFDLERLRSALESGLDRIDSTALAFQEIIPNGEYVAALFTVQPRVAGLAGTPDYFGYEQRLAWPGDDEDEDAARFAEDEEGDDEESEDKGQEWRDERARYRAFVGGEYYRGDSRPIGESTMLFEFLIPLYRPDRLDLGRIAHYAGLLKAGQRPTAVAVAALDTKYSHRWPEDEQGQTIKPEHSVHWCFANYLLDGHHKVFAAHVTGKPITLLSFISLGQSRLVPRLLELYQNHGGAASS